MLGLQHYYSNKSVAQPWIKKRLFHDDNDATEVFEFDAVCCTIMYTLIEKLSLTDFNMPQS